MWCGCTTPLACLVSSPSYPYLGMYVQMYKESFVIFLFNLQEAKEETLGDRV